MSFFFFKNITGIFSTAVVSQKLFFIRWQLPKLKVQSEEGKGKTTKLPPQQSSTSMGKAASRSGLPQMLTTGSRALLGRSSHPWTLKAGQEDKV